MSLNKIQKYAVLIALISLVMRLLMIGNHDLLVEEAYYWNYATHLDFGYLDHPPMVALLIKLSTLCFGTNEFGVRFASIVCWSLTALFTYKLTQKINPHAGLYAVMLLAILPFFFLHSLVMTPDLPLIVCWSASLYYLYKALVLSESKAWFIAGIWLGLGVLSKYSIVLLGPATLIYLILIPEARQWFARKEPYICLLITALLSTPVIYWNATHEWASFLFQSTRRLQEQPTFGFHELVGLLIIFLTPVGLVGFIQLFKNKPSLTMEKRYFLRVFSLTPLIVFSLFSLRHPIKFNWIGPSLLAITPWLAVLIQEAPIKWFKAWLITAITLLIIYLGFFICVALGQPEQVNSKILSKYISWENLTEQLNAIAMKTGGNPVFVALDRYNIASELTFYQTKLLDNSIINQRYDVFGSDVFGGESLMFRYWRKDNPLLPEKLILISNNLNDFNNPVIDQETTVRSKPQMIWAKSQGMGVNLTPYYYEVVLRHTTRE